MGGVNRNCDILHLGVFTDDECYMRPINWYGVLALSRIYIYTSTIMQNSLPG